MDRNIFISYVKEDKSAADKICDKLERSGLQCWIAPRNIAPGEKYAQSIINAIDGSKIVVVVFSRNADQSAHILTEIEQAFNHEKVIIPFMIEDIEPSDEIQYFFGSRQRLEAFSGSMDEHIDRLIEIIKKHLNKDFEFYQTQEKTLPSHVNQSKKIKPSKFYQIIYRSISLIIDCSIGFLIGVICSVLYTKLASAVIGQEEFNLLYYIPNSGNQPSAYGVWINVIFIFSGIIFWIAIIDISKLRSPGKALLGLNIYWPFDKMNSNKWRTIRAFIKCGPLLTYLLVRLLGYPNPNAPAIAFLLVIILLLVWIIPVIYTSKSQSIHDLVVGTIVISDKQ